MTPSKYAGLSAMAAAFADAFRSDRQASANADAQHDLHVRNQEYEDSRPISPRQQYDRFNDYQKLVLETADGYNDAILKERKAMLESQAYVGADEQTQNQILAGYDSAKRNLLRIRDEHLSPQHFQRYQNRQVGIDFSGVWDGEMGGEQQETGSAVPEQGTPIMNEDDMATGIGDIFGSGQQPVEQQGVYTGDVQPAQAPQPQQKRHYYDPSTGKTLPSPWADRFSSGGEKKPVPDIIAP